MKPVAFSVGLSVLIYFAVVGTLRGRTEITGFSVSGRITRIVRGESRIIILCSTPHYGVGVGGGYQAIVFWPANTPLSLKIAVIAPMTMDGEKIGFDQLAIGQTITAQYSIMESYFSDMYCTVRRLEGWTGAPPTIQPNVGKKSR